MSYPTTFPDADHYIDACIKFFDEYKFLFCFPNTHVLAENVLENIKITNLEEIDVFDDAFRICDLMDDKYMRNFIKRKCKLRTDIPRMPKRERNSVDNYKFALPISPKKRHEVINMVKGVSEICERNGCELMVDFGSGLGYVDQVIHEVTKIKVLGLESNESNVNCALTRQSKYHLNSKDSVKYVKHRITDDSNKEIEELIQKEFPAVKDFCIAGLHTCSDLTIQAMKIFLKMPNARSLVILPCCYHKLHRYSDGRIKNFPLSETFKQAFKRAGANVYTILNVPFLRLAANSEMTLKNLHEMAFELLSRAMLQLYADENNFTITRNKRKPVKIKEKTNFDEFIIAAATKGYTLTPKAGEPKIKFSKKDNIINKFNIDFITSNWKRMCNEVTFKKAGIFILMQFSIQRLAENFVLLDRLMFLKENGLSNCQYWRMFESSQSPRCLALIANKPAGWKLKASEDDEDEWSLNAFFTIYEPQ